MNKTRLSFLALLLIAFFAPEWARAQVNIPDWPAAQNRFGYSDKYEVRIKQGNGDFVLLETLMSKSQDELVRPGNNDMFKNRTFSYAPFSFNKNGGAITVRVKKMNFSGMVNSSASNVEVIGKSGKLTSVTKFDNNTVQFTLNNPNYVPGYNSAVREVKLWGWHENNDGFRPGPGSSVTDNFMRMVDDGLYVNETEVNGNVFWPSYNGSIVTSGWEQGGNSGGMSITNTTVLYPEWTNRGNNNGVFMSQLGDNAECVGVDFINMKIYGDPIALSFSVSKYSGSSLIGGLGKNTLAAYFSPAPNS